MAALPIAWLRAENLAAISNHFRQSNRLKLITGFSADRVSVANDAVIVSGSTASGGAELGPFDRIIVATGQRPDLDMTRELRLDLDPWLECPKALGPAIDPNLHSCGSVPPHGYRQLAHPEPGYFAVGVKSYGRAPTFLMATGYEQVRSVAAYLAGDLKAADDVQLVLPETGVCSTGLRRVLCRRRKRNGRRCRMRLQHIIEIRT